MDTNTEFLGSTDTDTHTWKQAVKLYICVTAPGSPVWSSVSVQYLTDFLYTPDGLPVCPHHNARFPGIELLMQDEPVQIKAVPENGWMN